MSDNATPNNLVESIIKEAQKPELTTIQGRPAALVPKGYSLNLLDYLMPDPARKQGVKSFDDTPSFTQFVKREATAAASLIYADVDFVKDDVKFTAVLNDNEPAQAHWRDYRAAYQPAKSVEWTTWTHQNKQVMTQAAFAAFIEDNVKDILAVDNSPSGAQMLALALDFEAKQDVIVKSAVRLQSGSVAFNYVDQEDDATVKRMEVFQRFTLGIAPFFNGTAYKLAARLKYRHGGGKLSFWYELIRPDLVLQDATNNIISVIKEATGLPVFYGTP